MARDIKEGLQAWMEQQKGLMDKNTGDGAAKKGVHEQVAPKAEHSAPNLPKEPQKKSADEDNSEQTKQINECSRTLRNIIKGVGKLQMGFLRKIENIAGEKNLNASLSWARKEEGRRARQDKQSFTPNKDTKQALQILRSVLGKAKGEDFIPGLKNTPESQKYRDDLELLQSQQTQGILEQLSGMGEKGQRIAGAVRSDLERIQNNQKIFEQISAIVGWRKDEYEN